MHKRLTAPLLALVLLAGACTGDSDNDPDGEESTEGLVAVLDNPSGDTAGFGQFRTGRDKSFGIFVCSNGGAVELESIEAIAAEGDIELLGAMVYTTPDRFIGAADGFPPDGQGDSGLEALEGAIVETDCVDPSGDDRVQIVVGAERTTTGGGMIEGLIVTTDKGDLEIPFTILLCGDELEYCDVLNETQGTASS